MARPMVWQCSSSDLCSCGYAKQNEILSTFCFCSYPYDEEDGATCDCGNSVVGAWWSN